MAFRAVKQEHPDAEPTKARWITKWRGNVLVLCSFSTGIAIFLLWKSIDLVERLILAPDIVNPLSDTVVPTISHGDVALVVGVATLAITITAGTVTGFIAVASQIVDDRPPPSVPADVHERTIMAHISAATPHLKDEAALDG